MTIWLITLGEPLPIDGNSERLLRTGILAGILSENKHEVVLWTSTFDHARKKHRFSKDTNVSINKYFRINLLHSTGYKRNISVRRFADHFGVAAKLFLRIRQEKKPDIILCSLPPPELCLVAAQYGCKRKIPVVLDIRDLWPDLFLDFIPKCLLPSAKALACPLFRIVRMACCRATAVTGVTRQFIDWGVKNAHRNSTPLDVVFPMGYSEITPKPEEIESASRKWHSLGILKENFNVCFFGTFGKQFDILTVIDAAKKSTNNPRIQFILCGDGENISIYKSKAGVLANMLFPGWINKDEIWTLMRLSSLGLAPYINSVNFENNIANKPIEYFSAGLPVVTSSHGALEELLVNNNCGSSYGNADDLASSIHELFHNRQRLTTMSSNATKLFNDHFVAEKIYTAMADYLLVAANSFSSRT
jgi:glycosyltransferase involved in cell wall biosynthesis